MLPERSLSAPPYIHADTSILSKEDEKVPVSSSIDIRIEFLFNRPSFPAVNVHADDLLSIPTWTEIVCDVDVTNQKDTFTGTAAAVSQATKLPVVSKPSLELLSSFRETQEPSKKGSPRLQSAEIIRPNPVKTTPPTAQGGGSLATPGRNPLSPTNTVEDSSSRPVPVQNKRVVETATTQQTDGPNDKDKNVAWCEEANAREKREKEDRKKKKIEEQRRRQEIQCNFSSSDHNMPSTSGRNSAEGESDAREQYSKPQPTPRANRAASSSSYLNGAPRARDDDVDAKAQPTPLFERLVTEEVQELKTYARIIENQNRRLSDLEKINGDLETRLEMESRQRQQLEATLEARERQWAGKFQELEADRDHWKEVVQAEQMKNSRLMDQVVRKDQDIHRMLQRKYDHEGRSMRSNAIRAASSEKYMEKGGLSSSVNRSPDLRADVHKSPHEILAASGSAEKVRVRNVERLLKDFFAM